MITGIRTLAIVLVFPGLACAHVFNTADGSESFEGKFLNYNERVDQVTLQLASGRSKIVKFSSLSEADQKYIHEKIIAREIHSSIQIEMDEEDDRKKEERGQMLYELEEVRVSFDVKNSSKHPLHDLKLNYWVVIERDNQGDEVMKVVDGSASIKQLGPNETVHVEGPNYVLTQGASSTCSCPKVAARAAQIGRDRTRGGKMELLDSHGDVLHTAYSSSRMEKFFEERAE